MKNIVFDLGNVLIRFNPQHYLDQHVPIKDHQRFFTQMFSSQTWLDLDRGILNYAEAITIFSTRLPEYRQLIEQFFTRDFFDMLMPIDENIHLLPTLKEQYSLYILSNFHREVFEKMKCQHTFFQVFTGGIISCYCHFIKPEPTIYQLLLNTYRLNPAKTVFIDDSEENIIAAKKQGIQGIHLPDYTQLIAKLTAICNNNL